MIHIHCTYCDSGLYNVDPLGLLSLTPFARLVSHGEIDIVKNSPATDFALASFHQLSSPNQRKTTKTVTTSATVAQELYPWETRASCLRSHSLISLARRSAKHRKASVPWSSKSFFWPPGMERFYRKSFRCQIGMIMTCFQKK